MNNLKVGDIIKFIGDDENKSIHREEIRGVCDKVIFTREILDNGFGETTYRDIDDVITMGWNLES